MCRAMVRRQGRGEVKLYNETSRGDIMEDPYLMFNKLKTDFDQTWNNTKLTIQDKKLYCFNVFKFKFEESSR